jgi:hypothetical protein
MNVACWIRKATYTHVHEHAHTLGHKHEGTRTHINT